MVDDLYIGVKGDYDKQHKCVTGLDNIHTELINMSQQTPLDNQGSELFYLLPL